MTAPGYDPGWLQVVVDNPEDDEKRLVRCDHCGQSLVEGRLSDEEEAALALQHRDDQHGPHRYGPNTQRVEALVERFQRMTDEERTDFGRAAMQHDERHRQEGEQRSLSIGRAFLEAERVAAENGLAGAAGQAQSDAWKPFSFPAGKTREAAKTAAEHAALALVVKHLISSGDFKLLYEPAQKVMPQPPHRKD